MRRWGTISVLLSLPVLVQFENVEENLAGQAALAAAAVWWEKRRRRLQWGQAPAGSPHRVQRRPRVAPAPRLAALRRHVASAQGEGTHQRAVEQLWFMLAGDWWLPEFPPQQVVDDVRVSLDQTHQDFLL